MQVYEKDDGRFEAEVSRAPKTFRWLKGSQELQKDDKYDIIQEGNMHVLIIRSAAYDDEAKYMFEAEDKRMTAKLVIQGNARMFQSHVALVATQNENNESERNFFHRQVSALSSSIRLRM